MFNSKNQSNQFVFRQSRTNQFIKNENFIQFIKNYIQNIKNKKIDNVIDEKNKTFDINEQIDQKIEVFFNFNNLDIEKQIKFFEQFKNNCTIITTTFNIKNNFYIDNKHVIVVFDLLNVVEIENIENNKIFIIDDIIYNKKSSKFNKHKHNYILIDN